MKAKTKWALKLAVTMTTLTGITTAIGFGCGTEFKPVGFGNNAGLGSILPEDTNGGIQVISGAKTTAIVYSNQVLANMSALTGVEPSTNTRNYYNDKRGIFSEEGTASTVTPPMLLSIMGLGAEACEDLLDAELAVTPTTDRRFLASVNLDAGPSQFSTQSRSDVIRRLARSFWARNESLEELNMILSSVNNSGISADNAESTRRLFLYTCTAMISSLDAIQL